MNNCPCPDPNEPCAAYNGLVLGARRWAICRGEGIDPTEAERYRALWAGAEPLPVTQKAASAIALPCIHLGEVTGERRLCPTCMGHVEVKLYECAIFGRCTRGKPLEGVACCANCSCFESR
jgi:hypothetical protein